MYTALRDELTKDPVDPENATEDRMDALLKCFAELVAHIPSHEYNQINEEITDFHDVCIKRKTYGFYVELVDYFCQKTPSDYEKHSKFYTTNILRYMNSEDKNLVAKVVSALNSINARLSKEAQFALVPQIRDAIE